MNDVPSFVVGANQTVNEDAGLRTVAGWATGISAGPANEANQTLAFTATNNNTALFLSTYQPAVSPDGTLTYRSAANKYGSATVSVFLKDDGGTALGGVDTSAVQTFSITVNPVNDAPRAFTDSYSVPVEGTLVVDAKNGVLANDIDADNDTLAAMEPTTPAYGELVLREDGSFAYRVVNSKAFNELGDAFTYLAYDGKLYSREPATVTLTAGKAMQAAEAPAGSADSGVLTYAELTAIANEAVSRWTEALDLDRSVQAQLSQVTFQIADLSGLTLGLASADTIVIDVNAAGYGWYVDATPADNLEFGLSLSELELMAAATSPALGRMDLLTVVMHELGHVLGYQDLDSSSDTLMAGTLDAGTRRLSDSTAESSKLVQMDKAPGAEVSSLLYGVKQGKSSWLEDFLVNGSDYNPFDPMDKVKISIPGNNGGGNKKKLH
jgi:VCBS repeat-containing protein